MEMSPQLAIMKPVHWCYLEQAIKDLIAVYNVNIEQLYISPLSALCFFVCLSPDWALW